MSNALDTREYIVDILRKELVGPWPGYPAIQIDKEEILRPQDPPRHRYGAGILFPMRSHVPRQDEISSEEATSVDADSPESDQIVDDSTRETPGKSTGASAEDSQPETDREVTLSNEYLPSAMGLSALLDVPPVLQIDVQAAVYDHKELQSNGRSTNGKMIDPKYWWRRPVGRTIRLSSDRLLGPGTLAIQVPVIQENGSDVLALHVVSRVHGESAGSNHARLITFTLINRRQCASGTPDNGACFYQCGFSVSSIERSPCFRSYPEHSQDMHDPEEQSLQLLYLHRRTFAVGHGCAADWNDSDSERTNLVRTEVMPIYEVKPILPTRFPGLDLSMHKLGSKVATDSTGVCSRLCDDYEQWIDERENEISRSRHLSAELRATARAHMDNCKACLRRMRDGIRLFERDDRIALAFRLMNEAMYMQQVHYTVSSQETRSWVVRSNRLELEAPFDRPTYGDHHRTWRPFQLAFILMNLNAVANPDCPERDIVDVIWFPTGGGKTEAYLGLSAFTMFLRRLRDPSHAGTTILMRYTLRLLTTQQFQRAASLICACEMIRRRESPLLGEERYSIGLWVGSEVTPNSERAAVEALRRLQSGEGANKFIMLSCPWCGAAMGPHRLRQSTRSKGYRMLAHPARVRLVCEDPDCDFSSGDGLPLCVIDEHIYSHPPTLLIGTVDKFAMLAFQPESRKLFGLDTAYPPPELIIQDELHLISGPLGSLVGHYETAIDELCTTSDEGKRVRPKIIGSTATISRASSQVRGLYGRDVTLFPPQALRAGDSFFAEESDDEPGRLYVGAFASALPSHVTAQIRTMGALLQAPKLFDPNSAKSIDPYWTMMGYFNSLRELGRAATLIRADIREFLNAVWDRLGLRLERVGAGGRDRRRFLNHSVELTSRIQSNLIPEVLQKLFIPYDGTPTSDVVDVCFATNMIQVGLDVPRLSLMTVVGQPKTTSEYIQASSRVGRDRPGIVVTNLNPSKPRDRSHYEHFRSYHQALYRYVEPTSVTAFSAPVRARALHALVVILCRFWGGTALRDSPFPAPSSQLIQRIKRAIKMRVESVDPEEWPATERSIDEFVRRWSTTAPSRYGSFGPPDEEIPLIYPAGGQQHPEWQNWPYATLTSMRNVDAECSARQLLRGYATRYSSHWADGESPDAN